MRELVYIILVIFSGCLNHKVDEPNFELIIEKAKSYRYDFNKEICTIFYFNKPSEEIKFHLSKEEKKRIYDKYYELNLNRLPQETSIEGTCMESPRTFTKLYFKRRDFLQKIEIESGCVNYNIFEIGRAKRIRSFIDYVYSILKSKPEIKNAPISNIHYL